MRVVSLLAGFVALAACVSREPPLAQQGCIEGRVRLHSAAPCQRTGPASFTLTIRPEAEPINHSPWYAFEIETETGAKTRVTLDYGDFTHRYRPKQRLPEGGWRVLPSSALALSDEGARAELSLSVTAGRTAIAAQEVLTREERAAWTQAFARRTGFTLASIGQSPNGHPILALHAGLGASDAPLVLILGGQHPPEVPGTLGLRNFLETLATQGAALLETHRFLIIPDLNPDGVEAGFWRLNSGLVDLNRDWGPFSHPETSAVKAELDRLTAAGARPVLMLDFHATYRSILYTPQHEAVLDPPDFASRWIAQIDRIHDGEMPEVSADHNKFRPTAKVWFAERFGAPGITVEYGDETARDEIDALSAAAAEALVAILADPG